MNRSGLILCFLLLAVNAAEKSRDFDDCVDQFCPPGRYCIAIHASKCLNHPCKPILTCVENEDNGCVGFSCPSGQVCVERTVSCIGRACRKTAQCAKPNTCDATVCPPSHKCVANPNPTCAKKILNIHDITEMEQTARKGE